MLEAPFHCFFSAVFFLFLFLFKNCFLFAFISLKSPLWIHRIYFFVLTFFNETIAYLTILQFWLFYTCVFIASSTHQWSPTCSLMSHEWLTKLFQVAHKLLVSSLLLPSQAKQSPKRLSHASWPLSELTPTCSLHWGNKPPFKFMTHSIINGAYQSNLKTEKNTLTSHTIPIGSPYFLKACELSMNFLQHQCKYTKKR